MKTKKLLIVGGGTSGLISGLILKTAFPELTVNLLESSAIGIIGVGEGSTEHWNDFIRFCGISKKELVEETNATFKYGINFVNWNGDNKNYFHAVNGEFNELGPNGIRPVYLHLVANDADPLQMQGHYVAESLLPENNYNINQFHFDTFKLNEFLHKKCNERGIKFIDDVVTSVSFDEQGFINAVVGQSGEKYEYDFYIDSTGFKKLILNGSMGIKWNSFQKYLPMNAAIAFPTERTEDIPAWTLSRAMSAGWAWRIPTQERFGNGYVFNDAFLDFEGAKAEIEALYGHEINVAKEIKFDAGCLEKLWNKNCVAIGLSGIFVEPLEASSIGTSIQQAFELAKLLPSFVPGNYHAENKYNKTITEVFNNILDYIALHYRVKRRDTDFWKSTETLPLPDGLQELLEIYNYKTPTDADFANNEVLFKSANWIMVMHGLGLLDRYVAQNDLNYLNDLEKNMLPYKVPNFDNISFVSHRQSLNNLKGKSKND